MARAKKKQKQDEAVEIAAEEIPAEEMIVAEEEVATDVVNVAVTETVTEALPAGQIPMTQEDIRLVEAILFATSSALTVGQISERFPADRVSIIPDILEHLKEQYSGRGVNLVQRDSRWAFRTATDLGDQLRLEKEQPKKFTRSAMETMAVIAYHQPVTRAEIENIRGVATSPGALDALMEAGWIKPGKRREVPGRPVTWLSTQGFLDHFGLERLEDLPGMDELKAAGLLDKRPAIEAMPTSDMFGEDENKQIEDPQEVTDEDLIGKSGESDSDEPGTGKVSEDEDFDDEEDDSDDYESDDDESDDDAEESSDEEDSEEEDSDEDDGDEDDDDDFDDEDEESEEDDAEEKKE